VSCTWRRHGLAVTGSDGCSIEVDQASPDPMWAIFEKGDIASCEVTVACAWPKGCVIASEMVTSKK